VTDGPEDGQTARARGVWFDLAVASLTSIAVIARLALVPGIPAFQQDWTWPSSPATTRGWLELATLPWNWNGLGSPQIYPFADYFVSACALLAMLVGSKVVLVLFVALATAVAGYSCALLARAIGVRSRLALAIAVIGYASSPVIFNKLGAGHTYYLIGYALLPVLCVQLIGLRSARIIPASCAIGLLLAASFSQAQFIVFDLAVLGIWAAVRNRKLERKEVVAMSAGTVFALCVHAYPLISLLHPQVGFALAHQRATIDGVASESVNLHDLLMQDGYPPSYFRRVWIAHPPIEWAELSFGSFALLGLLLALVRAAAPARSARFRLDALTMTIAIGVLGAVLTLGLNGPASPLLAYAFVNVPATSILKELYHAMVLVSLAAAVGAALGLDVLCGAARAIRGDLRRRFATAGLIAVACVFASASLPTLSGAWLNFTGRRDGTAFDREVARGLTSTPGRFLAYPVTPPIRTQDRSEGGGNDSDATRPWDGSSIFMGAPDPALAYLETATVIAPEVRIDYLFRRYGLEMAIERRGYVTAAPEQEALGAPFDGDAIGRTLLANGMHLGGSDAEYRTYAPDEPPAGLIRLGNAPVLAGDDVALADQDLSQGSAWTKTYTPAVFSADLRLTPTILRRTAGTVGTARIVSDWKLPADRFLDISRSIRGFDPNRNWTAIQDSYLRNRWQNFSPSGGIYTQSATQLVVPVGGRGPGRYVAALVARGSGDRAMSYAAPDRSDGDTLAPIQSFDSRARQHFMWFIASRPLRSTAPITFAIAGQESGVAIASIALLDAADVRSIERSSAGHRDAASSGSLSIRDATPTWFRGALENRGAHCSLTLLTSYDPRWTLRLDGALQDEHFRADGWANAWATACGRHVFEIAYDGFPFTLALVSGWTLLLLAAAVLVTFSVRDGSLRAWFARH